MPRSFQTPPSKPVEPPPMKTPDKPTGAFIVPRVRGHLEGKAPKQAKYAEAAKRKLGQAQKDF